MTRDSIRIMFYDEQKKAWVVDMMDVSEKSSQDRPAEPDDRDSPDMAAREAQRLS